MPLVPRSQATLLEQRQSCAAVARERSTTYGSRSMSNSHGQSSTRTVTALFDRLTPVPNQVKCSEAPLLTPNSLAFSRWATYPRLDSGTQGHKATVEDHATARKVPAAHNASPSVSPAGISFSTRLHSRVYWLLCTLGPGPRCADSPTGYTQRGWPFEALPAIYCASCRSGRVQSERVGCRRVQRVAGGT